MQSTPIPSPTAAVTTTTNTTNNTGVMTSPEAACWIQSEAPPDEPPFSSWPTEVWMGNYWKSRNATGRPGHGRVSTSSIDSNSSLDSTSSMDTTVSTDSQQQLLDDCYLMDVVDDNNNSSSFPETTLSRVNSAGLNTSTVAPVARKNADRGTLSRKWEDRNNNTINTIIEACEQREADISHTILSTSDPEGHISNILSTGGSKGHITNDNINKSSSEGIGTNNTSSSEGQITNKNIKTGSEGDCNKNTSSEGSKNATERTRLLDADGFIRRAACVCVDETESKVLLVSSKDHTSWLVPGGGVEAGEEAREAAVREAWEEAGVVGHVARYLGLFETQHHSGRKRHRTAVYVVRVKQVLTQYPEDYLGRRREWFSVEEALSHLSLHRPLQSAYLQLMLVSRLALPAHA